MQLLNLERFDANAGHDHVYYRVKRADFVELDFLGLDTMNFSLSLSHSPEDRIGMLFDGGRESAGIEQRPNIGIRTVVFAIGLFVMRVMRLFAGVRVVVPVRSIMLLSLLRMIMLIRMMMTVMRVFLAARVTVIRMILCILLMHYFAIESIVGMRVHMVMLFVVDVGGPRMHAKLHARYTAACLPFEVQMKISNIQI
jgi:hypothetical protein